MKIDKDALAKARETFQKYKAGKAALDKRIVENERWFRMQHWRHLRNRRQTGWLFAAIVNKHADYMDNKPEVNVLPREQSDEQTAKMLTSILPVLLERGGFSAVYDKIGYDKPKFGGGIYSVLWDPSMSDGLGDVRIGRVDPLNIFWEPGVEDIQESRNVFLMELVDHDVLKEQYPKIKELENLSAPAETVVKYTFDESVDTSNKSYVYNWYYRRNGVLHYCRFVQDILLFASENEKGYEKGWYEDGDYPFEIDVMYPEPGTPYGFGIIDTMWETQEDIDQLNDLVMRNAKQGSRRRYFIGEGAAVNEQEFCDMEKDIVHVGGAISDINLREIANEPYNGNYSAILENKVAEIKENSFNRDVNSGGTGGVTTASGLAAIQESGAKSSRAAQQASYRAFSKVIQMVIERIRQFYEVERIFRITGEDQQTQYVSFGNEGLAGRPIQGIGMDFGTKQPVFDLDVKVNKANAWSRAAQNQDVINFFNMGFFNPQNSTQALACLEVLEIENKDKLTETIKANGLKEQFNQQFLPLLLQIALSVDPQLGTQAQQAAMAAGLTQPMEAPMQQAQQPQTTADRGRQQSENYMARQRQIAANRTAPTA